MKTIHGINSRRWSKFKTAWIINHCSQSCVGFIRRVFYAVKITLGLDFNNFINKRDFFGNSHLSLLFAQFPLSERLEKANNWPRTADQKKYFLVSWSVSYFPRTFQRDLSWFIEFLRFSALRKLHNVIFIPHSKSRQSILTFCLFIHESRRVNPHKITKNRVCELGFLSPQWFFNLTDGCYNRASSSTSCRPGWLSFPRILKIARLTSTHWPHQHFLSS